MKGLRASEGGATVKKVIFPEGFFNNQSFVRK